MKLLVIGHSKAVLGFSLVGVHGRVATSATEVNQALDDALATTGVGIVLVTEDVASLIRARMDHLKMRSTVPLVVEIPAPAGAVEGARPGESSLRQVVMQALGIRI
jgi:vacuolar-type H+-ATPase subunit F/Vma7